MGALSMRNRAGTYFLAGLLTLVCGVVLVKVTSVRTDGGESITVAVAANFTVPAQVLAQRFEQETGVKVLLSFASTGKFYTQIVNGAPFDVFLTADAKHPAKLEAEGHAVAGTRRTYAVGRLVLWSKTRPVAGDGEGLLKSGGYNRLAIANPRHAPYGVAARETLEALGLWETVQPRVVTGENIGQTFTFVATGNAEVGFVALSQVMEPGEGVVGQYWPVPQELYSEIDQQSVLLKDTGAGRRYLEFLQSEESVKLIESYGYGVP